MSTALYRRYRPETFDDVIGQEHVTEPLMQALRTGRVNHAYLFSGPRGCGKTTSARILARCLNCDKGPTPTPCGECDSCVALSRGGAGSVDVIEIDAASHGGVDDARDLREKASYGPAQSRYKVYIIDEAHMVTPQGFNALLKIVEEPPEHVKFIFATTEPEKVIGTIRSRTHHYPFRLVPPARLSDYMAAICEREGVAVARGVLSFVVRAGGGSVRDSLSILDQLIAGSGSAGLTYESAAALLGFTDGELLDAVVNAFAAGDAATVFGSIDKVIETGQDPRRFVEDVLERLRDLIVVAAVPDGASSVLRGLPEDQVERMRTQAAAFGAGSLSRAADIVNAGLTEMTGATAPRLQLELIAARVLLPGAAGESGYAARLDRLERRLDVGGVPSGARMPVASPPPAAPMTSAPDQYPASPAAPDRYLASSPSAPGQPASPPSAPGQPASPPSARRPPTREPAASPPADLPAGPGVDAQPRRGASETDVVPVFDEPPAPEDETGPPEDAALARERPALPAAGAEPPGPGRPPAPAAAPATGRLPTGDRPTDRDDTAGGPAGPSTTGGPSTAGPPPPTGIGPGGIDVAAIRRAWPDVLAKVFVLKRTTWTLLSAHAQVYGYDGQRLSLSLPTAGLLTAFGTGPHAELVRQALIDVLGVDARVDGVLAAAGGGPAAGGGSGSPARSGSPAASAATRPSTASGPSPASGRSTRDAADASRFAGDSGPGSGPPGRPGSTASAGGPGRTWAGAGPDSGETAGAPSSAATELGGASSSAASELGWSPEAAPRAREPGRSSDWATAAPPAATAPSWATADVPDLGATSAQGGRHLAAAAPAAPAAPAPPAAPESLSAPSALDDLPDEDLVSADDESVDEAAESGPSVVERLLGGTVIDEIED